MSKQSNRVFDEQNKIYVDKSIADFKAINGFSPKPAPHSGQSSQAAKSTASSVTSQQSLSANLKDDVERALMPYFNSMLNLEMVFEEFGKNLSVFLLQNEEQAVLNLWSGDSLTGKTQMAKRFSGFEGFKPLTVKGIKTSYFDVFQIKDNFDQIKKDFLDKSKVPNNSVIFIDEVEKLLNPDFKIVDISFVQKFRKFIEDLLGSRKIFIVFIMQPKAQRADVLKLFENKLTSHMDFDVQFPEWTKESLVQTIFENVEKRNLTVEPEAAAILAAHCLKHGSIVELQGVLKLLDVELKHLSTNQITAALMQDTLKSRG